MPGKKKANIILDIDQTLISAEPTEEYDFKSNKQKAKKFRFYDMDGYYIVFERPGLQDFLDFLFENFNVSVWTAASKEYALYVLDKIILIPDKPKRKLDYFFFSYHCDISKKVRKSTKDLAMLWDVFKLPGYTAKNTLIIDDYDDVYTPQKNNCIFIPVFEFTEKGSEKDSCLDKLKDLLKDLSVEYSKTGSIGKSVERINSEIRK